MDRAAKIIGIILSLIALMGTVWAATDYTGIRPVTIRELRTIQASTEQLAKSLLELRFRSLLQKLEFNGRLTFAEQQELCSLARQLEYVNVPGC